MPREIVQIVTDEWHGIHCKESAVDNPSIENAFEAIGSLDGRVKTLAVLSDRDGSSLTIGGGAGRYVVFVSTKDEKCFNLLSADTSTQEKVVLNAGGQDGEYPAQQIVGLQQVLDAVSAFFQTDVMDSNQSWRSQW